MRFVFCGLSIEKCRLTVGTTILSKKVRIHDKEPCNSGSGSGKCAIYEKGKNHKNLFRRMHFYG